MRAPDENRGSHGIDPPPPLPSFSCETVLRPAVLHLISSFSLVPINTNQSIA